MDVRLSSKPINVILARTFLDARPSDWRTWAVRLHTNPLTMTRSRKEVRNLGNQSFEWVLVVLLLECKGGNSNGVRTQRKGTSDDPESRPGVPASRSWRPD